MAVKVTIEKKPRPTFNFADCALEGQENELLKVYLVWQVPFLLLLLILLALSQFKVAGGIAGWVFLSWLVYFVLAPQAVLSRLRRHGPRIRPSQSHYPEIKAALKQLADLVGAPEPEAFVFDEPVAKVEVLGRRRPYFMIITTAAKELLTPAELSCALARALLNARMGQVALPMLVSFMNDTPSGLRFLVAPMWFLAGLLMVNWQNMAQLTADRLTLLVIRNPRLCSAVMMKFTLAADPNARLSGADVEDYMRRGSAQLNIADVSAQFKLGQTVHTNPLLSERLKALVEYAGSPTYQEALKRMDEAMRQPQAVAR